ncbi:hypothetical protein DITRI_Ditri18aG0059100 [Diplodiscus trichospermus]
MSGDNFTDRKPKFPVLGDITNRSVKRGLSSILDDSGFNYKEAADSLFTKQACLGEENSIKEKSRKFQSDPNPNFSSTFGEIDTSMEDLVSVIDQVSDFKEGFDLSNSDDTLDPGEGVTQVGESLNDSSRNEDEDLCVGRLASSTGASIEWSRLPKSLSQRSRSFELERCVGLKNDGCGNLKAGFDMLKACSCHFCLKAAYIWSDLHYQDIKGRIAVLKKSQKEASILAQKSCKGKQTDIHRQGNANKSSKLESGLTSQWRSLFLNMEDIFVHESNQLMDLEQTTGVPSEK